MISVARFDLLLVALAALFIPAALPAQPAPPPFPHRQVIAGERLLVLDADGQLWVRPLPIGPQSRWAVIALPEGTGQIDGMYCAPDGSGNCAFRFGVGLETEIGLLPAGAAAVTHTGVRASRMFGFVDSTTLSFGRPAGAGRTAVYAFDTVRRDQHQLATLAPDETIGTIALNGRATLIARRPDGSGRTLAHDPAIVIPKDIPPNALITRSGMIVTARWSDAWVADPRAQNVVLLDVRSDSRGRLSVGRTSLGALPATSFLIDQDSLVTDAQGDVYGTATAASGRLIIAFCRDAGGQLGSGHLVPIPRGMALRLIGSRAGHGVLAVQSVPGYSPRIRVLRLLEPSPDGFNGRRCQGTSGRLDDSGIGTTDLPAGWAQDLGSITASDGTRLSYVLLRPRDRPAQRLIVHAYGAYGHIPDDATLLPSILSHLLELRTAIAFVTVRGDGHGGIAAAMASRTPGRQRAVDDLIAMTEHIRRQLPGLSARATAQGRSAGAWLAMEAALQRPDLFAGAIGFAGAYIFSDDPQVTGPTRFFGADDSFDRNGLVARSICSGQHFRLIHARNDRILSFAQAERFGAMLNARGCPAELVTFESGGHAVSVTYGTDGVERLIDAYYTASASQSVDSTSPTPARR